jgi:hypothetical protein
MFATRGVRNVKRSLSLVLLLLASCRSTVDVHGDEAVEVLVPVPFQPQMPGMVAESLLDTFIIWWCSDDPCLYECQAVPAYKEMCRAKGGHIYTSSPYREVKAR